MSINEKVRALRDPEFRAQMEGFEHPAGLIDENELKSVVGASEHTPDATPTITTSSKVCGTVLIGISAAVCPTTPCSAECGRRG